MTARPHFGAFQDHGRLNRTRPVQTAVGDSRGSVLDVQIAGGRKLSETARMTDDVPPAAVMKVHDDTSSATVDVPLEELRRSSGEPGGGLWGSKRPQHALNTGSVKTSPDSDVAAVAEPIPAGPPSSRADR